MNAAMSLKAGAPPAGAPAGALLFIAIFLFALLTLAPYPTLAVEGGRSLALDQLMTLLLAVCALIYAVRMGASALILQPRTIITLTFFWLLVTSLGAPEVVTASRRLLVAFLVCLSASLLLILPRSRENFTALLAICVATVLAMSYFGVFVIPGRAVHQASDIVEPALAGDWRGVFEHKNIAASAMVILVFMSLYISARFSRLLGWALAILALVFLIKTNGKSALGLLPLALVLGWLIIRAPRLGSVILITLLVSLNILTVGSALSPAIFQFIAGLGIDATFTSRTDVWKLALNGIAQHPWTGHGFHSFWQVDTLQQSEAAAETWAVTAAHAHNAYIDVMLDGGVPALLLTLIWLVFSPIRDLSLAQKKQPGQKQGACRKNEDGQGDWQISLLFVRIWVFALIQACFESNFYMTRGLMWFALLVAVFGLNLQARAELIVDDGE